MDDFMSKEKAEQLIKAIENNEMFLVYQPIHDRRNQILAYEVLMRWKSKEYGNVSPLEMVASFEESSLVDYLNNWFFHHLQMDICATPELKQSRLSINLSFKQLKDGSLENYIANLAKVVPLGNMIFEITQSTVMHDIDKVLMTMRSMVDKGVSFILDNFGSDFSSLKYLKVLPLRYIKIDKSFIGDIDINHVDRAMVKAAIEMAKAIGLEVIAEGVEKENQVTILHSVGIYFYQGYYFSHPKQACDLERN